MRIIVRRLIALLVPILLLFGLAGPAAAQGGDCAALANLQLPDVRITTAQAIPGGTSWALPPSPFNLFLGPNAATDARFCRVVGVIEREIGFEIWLPPVWNQRYLGVGNGGYTGAINYPALIGGVARGFATASTDTGHVTPGGFFDSRWMPGHPDRVENFGRRGHHRLAETAKRIVRAFYGRRPTFSYFEGCSSGGWQGLTEAQQYPGDYDGIVAGAPANNFVRLQTRGFWTDALHRQYPAGDLGPPQVAMINAAALALCDPADGVRDGIIGDPLHCGFDPAALLCRPGQSENCLTQAQVDRAHLVYGPARSAGGRDLYPGNPYGVAPFITLPPGAAQGELPILIVSEGARRWTPETFDSDRDLPGLEARFGATLGAWNPDLSAFRARGGKLITYHGWADPLLSAYNSIAYREAVAARMGPDIGAFYRLFMVPGVEHCRGGPGTDRFDLLGSVIAWREQGRAPDQVVASGRLPAGGSRTRLLCPHPQVAHYDGSGSSDDAASYRCVAPGS
jgi:feruloyl esterase